MIKRGFEGSEADWVAHVCFDSYFGSPRIFFYTPEHAVAVASSKQGVPGSRAGNTQKATGFGVNATPSELSATAVEFTPSSSEEDLGARGEDEVRIFYEARGWIVRRADKKEQIRGKFDFEVTKGDRRLKIEVKARGEDKPYARLFIQTHEANPDKRIK